MVKLNLNKGVVVAVAVLLIVASFGAGVLMKGAHTPMQTMAVGETATYKAVVNIVAWHPDGTVFFNETGENLIVNTGLDFIKQQIAGTVTTNKAIYIALSTDGTSPSASWTSIPNEISTGGLTRAAGTYTSTGTGAWTVSKTFTATSSFTGVQLTGLYYQSSGNTLFAAKQFSSVNLANGDQIQITWSISVS